MAQNNASHAAQQVRVSANGVRQAPKRSFRHRAMRVVRLIHDVGYAGVLLWFLGHAAYGFYVSASCPVSANICGGGWGIGYLIAWVFVSLLFTPITALVEYLENPQTSYHRCNEFDEGFKNHHVKVFNDYWPFYDINDVYIYPIDGDD